MNDNRRSSFQFGWVIKWLFLYQVIIQFFHELSVDGHNDNKSDSDSFQYDQSLLYQYVFLLFQFNGGTIIEILKTALGGYDLAVVPGALIEYPESPIAPEKIKPESTYDHESRHDHFRARAYDPFMGRFLQTDPMGYADSMNLYQAFNMNPFNFTDPMGELSFKKWALGAAEGFVNFAVGIGSMLNPNPTGITSRVNFTDSNQPVFINEFDNSTLLEGLADRTLIKPAADFVTDVSVNAYLGFFENNITQEEKDLYQQDFSKNLGQIAGMVLLSKATKIGSNNNAIQESGLVYRRLSQKQIENGVLRNGIEARDASAIRVTPEEHVLGAKNSPWISTTRDYEGVAKRGYSNSPKNPIAEIDLSKTKNSIVDLSTKEGRARNLRNIQAIYNAARDAEVLINKHIPVEAIIRIIWPGGN